MTAQDLRHLWKPHQVYYFKFAIPVGLRNHFPSANGKPKDKIVESLQTGDLREAQRRRNQLLAEYEAKFERLRREHTDRLSLPELVTDFQDFQTQWEDYHARHGMPRIYLDVRIVTDDREQFNRLVDPFIERDAAEGIEIIAKRNGLTLQPGSPQWRHIGLATLAAEGKTFRMEGTEAASKPKPVKIDGPAFMTVFERFAAEMAESIKATTLAEYRSRAEHFAEHIKNAPLAAVDRKIASEYLAKLAADGLANGTINTAGKRIGAVFTYAKRHGLHDAENPFDGLRRKAKPESYKAFRPEELDQLFKALAPEVWPAKHSHASAFPWVVAICAYSGLRVEEAAQLRVCDLAEDHGITYFDITRDAGPLKTDTSVRRVPVHSELVRAGLLRYAEALPRDGRLFPGLTVKQSTQDRGAPISERFRKLRTSLGIVRDGLSLHSLRSTVATTLERAEASQTDVARVLGHKIKVESFGTYSTGPGLKRLKATVERIDYGPDVRLPVAR